MSGISRFKPPIHKTIEHTLGQNQSGVSFGELVKELSEECQRALDAGNIIGINEVLFPGDEIVLVIKPADRKGA